MRILNVYSNSINFTNCEMLRKYIEIHILQKQQQHIKKKEISLLKESVTEIVKHNRMLRNIILYSVMLFCIMLNFISQCTVGHNPCQNMNEIHNRCIVIFDYNAYNRTVKWQNDFQKIFLISVLFQAQLDPDDILYIF